MELPQAIAHLETLIGYTFSDKSLIEAALTHRSSGNKVSYERLEFLGDRILALTIASALYKHEPHLEEGEMTRRLVELVRRETLSEIAADLDLFNHLDHNLAQNGGIPERSRVGADCCEAILGAIYLDGSWDIAQQTVLKLWKTYWKRTETAVASSRSLLQEWAQQRGYDLPEYMMLDCEGDDHAPVFRVSVRVEGLGAAEGIAQTKKRAFHIAAERLLERLKADES